MSKGDVPSRGSASQEGDTLCDLEPAELKAESVYGGDIQSIRTDH